MNRLAQIKETEKSIRDAKKRVADAAQSPEYRECWARALAQLEKSLACSKASGHGF